MVSHKADQTATAGRTAGPVRCFKMVRNAKTEEPEQVMVYGASWCEHTTHVRRLLAQWGIRYHFIDIDKDHYAMCKVSAWNLGKLVTPAVTCGALENPRLLAPKDEELHAMLFLCQPVRVGPLIL
jgi:glutaredoxin